MSDKEKNEIIAEVGGSPDECGVSLCIYGEKLIPDVITEILRCQPTHAHKKGDKKGPRSPALVFEQGAWILNVQGEPPMTAEVLTRKLLMMVPSNPEIWKQLKDKFEIQIRYGIHMSGWNKGFGLSHKLIDWMTLLCADVEFDIYSYGDEEDV
ncbi:MAG: DUF4279 domain-containing protein [Desulfuromonadaceae bacterium]